MLPRIGLHALLVEVTAVAVVDDERRKALDLEPSDRLGAQVLVRDDLELLHELRQHRARAPDRAEVDRLVPLQGVPDALGARALADRRFEAEREQPGCEL